MRCLAVAGSFVLAAILATAYTPVWADHPATQEGSHELEEQEPAVTKESERPHEHAAHAVELGEIFRASHAIGMEVRNAQDEEFGKIKELAITGDARAVKYAILSSGGFLGLGDTLHPIPWYAVKILSEEGEKDVRFVLLDIDKERLKLAPILKEDAWSQLDDKSFTGEIDSFYKVGVEYKAGEPAAEMRRLEEEAMEGREDEPVVRTAELGMLKASGLLDMTVSNDLGDELGGVEDFVFDARTGDVRYIAVSVGGFLGLGETLVAVPADSFRFGSPADRPEELHLVINADKGRLEWVGAFDKENWPQFASERWQMEREPRVVREPSEIERE